MAQRKLPYVSKAFWSHTNVKVGDQLTATALVTNAKKGTTINFTISEYSGKRGGGFKEVLLDTLSSVVTDGKAKVQWTVQLVRDESKSGPMPEYRARAVLTSDPGVATKLAKLLHRFKIVQTNHPDASNTEIKDGEIAWITGQPEMPDLEFSIDPPLPSEHEIQCTLTST